MVDKVKLEEYFSVLTLKFTKKILAVENEEIVERLRRDKLSLLDKRRLSLLSSFQEKKKNNCFCGISRHKTAMQMFLKPFFQTKMDGI